MCFELNHRLERHSVQIAPFEEWNRMNWTERKNESGVVGAQRGSAKVR